MEDDKEQLTFFGTESTENTQNIFQEAFLTTHAESSPI